ncbi:MAG TPA: Hsp20/alpha crystallin family protein [Candidatus Paceibacterota bacterium]|nr:Hsp20/alpha crystallin family protein [Candidatus Paceibacterota bacterium]
MKDYFDDNEYDYEPPLTRNSRHKSKPEGQLTVDVHQEGDYIVVKSTVAGVNQDDIDINITSDKVTIRGIRNPDRRINPEDYYHQELYWGPFSRSIILPVDIDVSGARASIKNGMLTIRLPTLEARRSRRIRIEEL